MINSMKLNKIHLHKILKIRYLVMSFVCSLLFSTSFLYAEDDSDYDPLYKQGDGKMYDAVRALSGFGGGIGGNRQGILGNLNDVPFLSLPGLVEEEIEESGATKEPLKPIQGNKMSGFHTYIPKKQFSEFLKSSEWEDIYDKSIKGSDPAMIGATTWNLANSSVGEARFYALMQAQNAISNHYLAELSFIKQVEQYPHMKQEITDAYFSCVRKKMTEEKKYTWFQAQEACMGDESESNVSERVTASLFTFKDVADKEGRDDNQICLTDYMLKQEGEKNKEFQEDFKKSYHAYIGDILFKVDDKNAKTPTGMLSISYKVESPGENGECIKNGSSDKKPYELTKSAFAYRYKTLVTTLYEYCNQVRFNEGGDDGIKGGQAISKRKNFEESHKNFFATYTISGFSIDGQTLDNIIDLLDNDSARKDGVFSCDTLKKFTSAQPLEDIKKAFIEDDVNKSAFQFVLYTLSVGVTKATLLQTYEMLYNYLARTTMGAFAKSSNTYELAVQQINNIMKNSVGTDLADASMTRGEILVALNKLIYVLMEHQNASQAIVDFGKNIVGQGQGDFSLMGQS